jgi:hypothetical protein
MDERNYSTEWFGGIKSRKSGFEDKLYNQVRRFTKGEVDYYEVKLQKGYMMLCDIEDYEKLSTRIWTACGSKNSYAMSKSQSFQRLICPEWKYIDYINQNTLDNRKKNLRRMNLRRRVQNYDGLIGLNYDKKKKGWRVRYRKQGKRKEKFFSGSQNNEVVKQRAFEFRDLIDQKDEKRPLEFKNQVDQEKSHYLYIKNIID